MSRESDYYTVLRITRDASPEDIRRAYHLAARQAHPDASNGAGKTELFLEAQEAYEILSDPKKRAEYDKSHPPMVTEPPALEISITYSRPSLSRIDEHQLIYTLLEFKAPPEAKSLPRPPLNLCLVIDRSTSMQGERMGTVKRTASELIHQLQPEDIVSIVTFSDRAEVLISAKRRPEDHRIDSQIQRIQAGGGTEIYQGLEAGFLEIRRNTNRDHIDHMILLTDGRTYGDESACVQLAEQAASFGVGISCLGIGHEWNDTLLDSLALRTGGSIMFVSQPAEIREFLTQKISGLHQVYAERVTLEFSLESGVELEYIFRRSPDAAPLPTFSPIRLGNIPTESELSLVIEFKVPPIRAAASQLLLSKGQLTLETPGQTGVSISLPINLSLPVSDSPSPDPPPTKFLKAISRLTLYRMQERAQQYLAAGKTAQASQHLNNLATQLFSRGEYDLGRTVLEEANNLQHSQGISDEGKKRIKYGTRALLLPEKTPASPSRNHGGGKGL